MRSNRQNVAADHNKLTDLTNSSLLNGTALNSTGTFNSSTPVLLNCTKGNTTDLSHCTPINITLSYECTKVDYDFLIYSVSWQPKLCQENNCSGSHTWETPKWRIQGLRGSFANGTRPIQCCSDRQLKVQELDPIYSELKDKWVFEKDANVNDSLIEDWNLHGSCVQQFESKSSLQLYSQSLDIAKKLPIQVWLSNAKIEPSNYKKYGLEFINYTIASKIGKMFQLRCKTLNYDHQLSIIDTINVCVDRNSNEVIDCPGHFDSNCLVMIVYPTHLLEMKVPEEQFYRDMNYYRYANYHNAYSPMNSSRAFFTGAAVGAIPAATLALPAAYYYFKNKNKYAAGGFPGGYGAAPWYSSKSFAKSHNLGGANNLYPRQSTPNYYPPSIYSTSNNRPGSAPYPYTPAANLPTHPYKSSYPASGAYPKGGSPSFPRYPGLGGLPQAPPPYSKTGNKYSGFDNPPPYAATGGKYAPRASPNKPKIPGSRINDPLFPNRWASSRPKSGGSFGGGRPGGGSFRGRFGGGRGRGFGGRARGKG